MSKGSSCWAELAREFQPHELEHLDKGGKRLTYIKAWAIQDRLDTVVGPENWSVDIHVTTADPRPVYTCTLKVKNPDTGVWAIRSATSGEPFMPGGPKGGPDFENAGKGGATQAFKKAFQDGFCRYLMKGDAPEEVPISWGKDKPAAKPLPANLDTDDDWNEPEGYPAPDPGDMSPEQQRAELENMRGPKPTDFSPLIKRGMSLESIHPDAPPCPTCGGKMWDNREPERGGKGQYPKKNKKQPDFKCRKKECDGVLWPSH